MNLVETSGARYLEGPPGAPLLASARDIDRVLEAVFEHRCFEVLLDAANLPPAFFDLSTGECGAILQKLRNYGVRLAIVRAPGGPPLSAPFQALAREELRRRQFLLADTRDAAVAWLTSAR